MALLSAGESVLLLWGGSQSPDKVQKCAEQLRAQVTDQGEVQVENIDRLTVSNLTTSHYDRCVSGVGPSDSLVTHSLDTLAEICRMLKPKGWLILHEAVGNGGTMKTRDKLLSTMKMSGFVEISHTTANISPEDLTSLQTRLGASEPIEVARVTGRKPDYEVGSSTQLKISLPKQVSDAPHVDADVARVWNLNADDMVDDDVDLIDSDDLLDDDDFIKPAPESLRASCGTETETTKKKACKNCTCGLADEIASEKKPKTTQNATSACGSCYLGDAFRCSSCPYLGMPPFKPGEKIELSARQLQADA